MKTASAVLVDKVARSGHLMEALVRSGMVSKRLRQGVASEVGYALRYSLMVKAPFTEAEVGPALAAKPGDGVEYVKTWRQPSPALEAALLALGDPFLAYRYASAISGGKHRRWPEGEPLIASNLETGFRYAWTILQSQRFPAVEPLVARFPGSQFGLAYIKEVLKGDVSLLPGPPVNLASVKTASTSLTLQMVQSKPVLQALDRLGVPKRLRTVLYARPNTAMNYAFAVGHPVPEAEPSIAQDASSSYFYATNNRAPFPAGEPAIAEDPMLACRYAMGVLHARWPAIEPLIARTILTSGGYENYRLRSVIANYYWSLIAKNDMQEGEGPAMVWAEGVLAGKTAKTASNQLDPNLLGGDYDYDLGVQIYEGNSGLIGALRRYGFESKAIVDSYKFNPELLLSYIHYVRKTRCPELEPYLKKNPHVMAYYAEEFLGGPTQAERELEAGGYQPHVDRFDHHDASAKTASVQFPRFVNWLSLVAPLDRNGMLSKRLRDALAHIPGREAEMGYRVAVLMGRRFPEAEPAIAADAGWAVSYVTKFFPGYSRWPEAEPAIARATLEGIARPGTLSYSVLDYVMDRIREAGEVAGNATIKEWAERVLAGKSSSLKIASARLNPALGTYQLLLDLQRTKLDRGVRTQMAALTPDQLWPIAKRLGLIGSGNGFPWPEVEAVFAQDPEQAFRYVNTVLYQPCPVLEPAIASNPKTAYSYATMILHGRFPAGEPAISFPLLKGRGMGKGCYAAMCYFRDYVLGDRQAVAGAELDAQATAWAESVAARAKQASRKTASNQLNEVTLLSIDALKALTRTGAMTKGIKAALGDSPMWANAYAADVLGGRFPEGEATLALDILAGNSDSYGEMYFVRVFNAPYDGYDEAARAWAKEVLVGEVKQASLKTASSSLSINLGQRGGVLATLGRHSLMSKPIVQAMKSNPRTAVLYAADVVKQRCPELEPIILTDAVSARLYAWAVLKGKRWKEAEPIIARDPRTAGLYATGIMKKPWPEAEPAIARGNWVSDYCDRCLKIKDVVKVMDWVHAMRKVPIPPLPGAKTAAATVHRSLISPNLLTALQRYNMLSKPMLEAITESSHFALIYANYVLETRFPAGEPAIARGNGIHLYGKFTLAKSDDNEAKLAFARMATKLNSYDLVSLLKDMKATDPTEDLRERCLATLTGGLCFCLLYHEQLPKELEWSINNQDRDVNEQAALEYVQHVLQAPWPAFERYLARVHARNTVHAGIFARNYLSLACIKQAHRAGATFAPEFTQAFLTDPYTETWSTYAAEYESAPMTGREIQDTHVFASRLAANSYSSKPEMDPWVFSAYVFGSDRDYEARKKIAAYLKVNHPECVDTTGEKGFMHVEWVPTKAMSRAAAKVQGLTMEDFVKVYGERRIDDYQMAGFFGEHPVQGSLKTASTQLDFADTLCLGNVIGILLKNGMLTTQLKQAFLSTCDPADAINAVRAYCRPWPEAEPILAQDPSIAADYATETLKGRFPLAEQEWHKAAPSWWKEPTDVPFALTRYYDRLVRTDPPHADSYFKGAWRWLQGEGKQASSKTASSKLTSQAVFGDAPYHKRVQVACALQSIGVLSKFRRYLDPVFARTALGAYLYAEEVLRHKWDGPLAQAAERLIDWHGMPGEQQAYAALPEGKPAAHQSSRTASSQLPSFNSKAFYQNGEWVISALERYRFLTKATTGAIASNPEMALALAKERGARWPEAEPAIASDAGTAYFYALYVIKGQWPEAEPAIFTSPRWASLYAIYVLKQRRPLEPGGDRPQQRLRPALR